MKWIKFIKIAFPFSAKVVLFGQELKTKQAIWSPPHVASSNTWSGSLSCHQSGSKIQRSILNTGCNPTALRHSIPQLPPFASTPTSRLPLLLSQQVGYCRGVNLKEKSITPWAARLLKHLVFIWWLTPLLVSWTRWTDSYSKKNPLACRYVALCQLGCSLA